MHRDMILLIGPLLFVLLGFGAVKARKAGLSRWEVALLVAVGTLINLVVTYMTVIWGWLHFG
jgi:hypothetical protein